MGAKITASDAKKIRSPPCSLSGGDHLGGELLCLAWKNNWSPPCSLSGGEHGGELGLGEFLCSLPTPFLLHKLLNPCTLTSEQLQTCETTNFEPLELDFYPRTEQKRRKWGPKSSIEMARSTSNGGPTKKMKNKKFKKKIYIFRCMSCTLHIYR